MDRLTSVEMEDRFIMMPVYLLDWKAAGFYDSYTNALLILPRLKTEPPF